jgi:tagatose-1,6-bisphosphate aldolase non-catalytic subunit AgaZ/GatZ
MDGGYTKMTQHEFVEKTRQEAAAISYDGPIIFALDHGGPWLKDIQAAEKWDLEKCMAALKLSLEESVKAGYDLLHIDPTVDITLTKGAIIPIDLVAERTVELISHTEKFRRQHKYPKISYEVGTEEVHGGLADLATFRKFLDLLKQGLADNNLDDVWPCFVVGKVGTDLHTTLFDPAVAKELTGIVAEYGSAIKGHYTDNVTNPEEYPKAGMGAANVGPEFTEAEYDGLMRLVAIENTLIDEKKVAVPSRFKSTLTSAVIDSGRWKKWLLSAEQGKAFEQLKPDRREWLTQTGCRYIWAEDSVYAARRKLYDNCSDHGVHAEEVVLLAIERAMDKYFNAFNLINLNDKLQ